PQGVWLSVNARPLRDPSGALRGGVVVLRDITERRRQQEALAKERHRLRTLMDNLPDCVFLKDAHSRFLASNCAHLEILGARTPEEVVGRTDFDFFPPELAQAYHADEEEIFRPGRPLVNRQERVVDRAGRERWVLTSKVPLRDDGGAVVGLV